MPARLNRVLQVRALDRLRDRLARDAGSGLTVMSALSDADQHELCVVGGGRLAAVAVRVRWQVIVAGQGLCSRHEVQSLAVREVARVVHEHVRRMDLLGLLRPDTLLVLAPGLDQDDARTLARRLRDLLGRRQLDLAAGQIEVRVEVGSAYRFAGSPNDWSTHQLAVEAELNASEAGEAEAELTMNTDEVMPVKFVA